MRVGVLLLGLTSCQWLTGIDPTRSRPSDAAMDAPPVDASSPVRLVPFPPFNKGSLALHADEQSVLWVEDRTSELFSALPDGGPKHLASLGAGTGGGMARLDGVVFVAIRSSSNSLLP